MKKPLNTLLIILAVLTLSGVGSIVRAQQANHQASENSRQGSDYTLPYPGILPDNPLYPLKMIRDKIVSIFISDPLKKAEFNLLMADKRINSGKYLKDKQNFSLVESTISKGQNYLEQAIEVVIREKSQGKDISVIANRINKASLKHEEVIKEIEAAAPESLKTGLRNALERTKQAQEKIKTLLKK